MNDMCRCFSDPFHERYGNHLTMEEVDELITPHPESIELVSEWLASHGLSEDDLARSSAKDWIRVRVPISLAEKMLDTVRLLMITVHSPCRLRYYNRNTISGRTKRTATLLFAQPPTVYQNIFTTTSISFNPPLSSRL